MREESITVKKRYDRFSLFYDIFECIPEKLFFSRWRKEFISPLEGNILEVGIGTGKNLQYYSKKAKVTGIELSPKMLKKAIRKCNTLKRNYSLLQMDAQDLKLKADLFDNVISTFVLCSVPDPVKSLKEMKRVCKPNGKIILIEHVKSKNKIIAVLQDIHNPIIKLLFGFNVNRNTISNIKEANLKIISERNLALDDIFKFIVCKPGGKENG